MAERAYAAEAGYDYKATAEMVAKWKAEDGKEPRQRTKGEPAAKTEPTLTDLLRVKELVGNDAEGFAAKVKEVVEIADGVGGLKVLHQCLEALAKLQA